MSTGGNYVLLGGSCISWLSKKRPTMATASFEAEYRVAFTALVECVWPRRLLMDLRMELGGATIMCTAS